MLNALIVDDSRINIISLSHVLNTMECESSGAASADEALKLLRRSRFDIVFTDYLMPEMNGTELAKQIRNMEESEASSGDGKIIPIIIFSADDEELEKVSKSEYVSGTLKKPVAPEDVYRVLNRYFSVNIRITGLSYAPEEYGELFDEYISELRTDIDLISSSLAANDFENYCVAVHKLKGEARLMDNNDTADAAYRLELASKALLGRFDSGNSREADLTTIMKETPALLKKLTQTLDEAAVYFKIKDNVGL